MNYRTMNILHHVQTRCCIISNNSKCFLSRFFALLTVAWIAVGSVCAYAAEKPLQVDHILRKWSINAIRDVFAKEQRWIKVYAAEYLLALDYSDGVKEAFNDGLKLHGVDSQYCIGIWQVLTKTSSNERYTTCQAIHII